MSRAEHPREFGCRDSPEYPSLHSTYLEIIGIIMKTALEILIPRKRNKLNI